LPAVKVGRVVRIREDVLHEWLEKAAACAPVKRGRGRPRKVEMRRRSASKEPARESSPAPAP
jgi:hypothetical protein